MPDGESGIFFARGLDRANQLDASGEFAFKAQGCSGAQRQSGNPASAQLVSRTGTPIWLNLQSAYDLRLAYDAIGREVAALPTRPAKRRAGA